MSPYSHAHDIILIFDAPNMHFFGKWEEAHASWFLKFFFALVVTFENICRVVFQARQVLDREFNNLLALGTDRRLEEVTQHVMLLIRFKCCLRLSSLIFSLPRRAKTTSLFAALRRGGRGFVPEREGRGWGWWRAPWKRCPLASACPLCPCRPPWCPRSSCSLKVRTDHMTQTFGHECACCLC